MARADDQLNQLLKGMYAFITSPPKWETSMPWSMEKRRLMQQIVEHLDGAATITTDMQQNRIPVFSDASKDYIGLKVGEKTFSFKMREKATSATVLELAAIHQSLAKLN